MELYPVEGQPGFYPSSSKQICVTEHNLADINFIPNLHQLDMATQWPPENGLSTPVVSRSDGICTTVAAVTVAAPAKVVFDLVMATATYPEWNTWIPRVTIKAQPEGVLANSTDLALHTQFVFHVIMDETRPDKMFDTPLRVTDVSTPDAPSSYIPPDVLATDGSYVADLSTVYRVAWKTEGGWLNHGMRSERFHEIVALGEAECELRTWEVMGGFLARTVKWTMGKTLDAKFMLWCTDLKKAAEARHGGAAATAPAGTGS